MLFDAHTRSFEAFAGIPRRGIYDNMKTAVDRVQRGKTRIVNARFLAMCGRLSLPASQELAIARLDVEILRKATAYFAKGSR